MVKAGRMGFVCCAVQLPTRNTRKPTLAELMDSSLCRNANSVPCVGTLVLLGVLRGMLLNMVMVIYLACVGGFAYIGVAYF